MKKSLLIMMLSLLLFGCSYNQKLEAQTENIISNANVSVLSTDSDNNNLEIESEVNMQKLRFFVDDVEVDVSWEDDASVNQIKELAKNNPITINAH